MMVTLETERLTLRPFRPADFPVYAEMAADPETMRFIGSNKTMGTTEAWRSLATQAGHWMLRGYGMWALEEKATNSISIEEFVPLAEVDRIYLEKVYYLGPDKGGDRAYRLMCEALKETKRAAIGQYAARGQEHLVLVRPKDGVLIMEQLHYNAELRPSSEVPIGEGDVKPAELTLAKQLIEQAAVDEFHPERYKDKVHDRVMEAIQQKVEGQEIVAEPQQETGAKIIDLMEALKASLGKSGGKATAKAKDAEDDEAEEKPAKKKATRKKAG